jgi:hypothetical protein
MQLSIFYAESFFEVAVAAVESSQAHSRRFNLELSNDRKINCANLSILKCSQRIGAK